ncbi:MAG: Putative NUDIX/MutT-family hydrolase [uncultured Nocardioides sp.]|uniref:NUDIX/MutT-family hydrolase n=1 Tax=uncultured Nocardioides sp. TaxID=198441 RepID=A0A6J4NEP9_9ACTN|nr:MAG: Putative NUDIX/MutT-family hydrolase [uncultured Nocardioides sp.]
MIDHARAYAAGESAPAEPRNAATVVLLRDGSSGVEVYLLRRQATMAFAAGMCVFPGGGVDPRDFSEDVAWAGPSVEEWARTLGCEPSLARALVCAAVRETFEESGVLLAGTSADSVVEDTTGDDWEADRVALETRELSMTDFLVRRGLVLRTDLLGAWSGWLTPVFEPKRYRTWFFVAVLPGSQTTRDVSSESSSVMWLPALEAVAAVEGGEVAMMPPTFLTCLDIGQHASTAAALEAAGGRTVEIFTPEVIAAGDDFILSTPSHYEALLDAR